MNKKINRLIIFLVISLTWSFLWFTNKKLVFQYIEKIPSLQFYFLGIIPVIGILIPALVLRQKQPSNKMSLTGNSFFESLLIASIPILILTIIGVPNDIGFQPKLFGFIIGSFTMIYALFEEFGWRGYLQEELFEKYNKWLAYIIIGVIWYLWHWYFFREENDPKLIMIPILILASVGIGEVAKSTKSILICGALHGLVNILLIYGVIAENMTDQEKIILLIVSLIIWIPIIKKIEKKNAIANDV